MKQNLHRILSLLLLFIFLYNIGGYFIAFIAIQYQVRNEIKAQIREGIAEDELHQIILPANPEVNTDFSLDDEQEIKYNGKMYDIVKQIVKGDSIYFYCILDEEETELFEDLDEDVEKEIASASNKDKLKTLKNFIKDYLLQLKEDSFCISPLTLSFSLRKIPLESAVLHLFSPPPEIV